MTPPNRQRNSLTQSQEIPPSLEQPFFEGVGVSNPVERLEFDEFFPVLDQPLQVSAFVPVPPQDPPQQPDLLPVQGNQQHSVPISPASGQRYDVPPPAFLAEEVVQHEAPPQTDIQPNDYSARGPVSVHQPGGLDPGQMVPAPWAVIKERPYGFVVLPSEIQKIISQTGQLFRGVVFAPKMSLAGKESLAGPRCTDLDLNNSSFFQATMAGGRVNDCTLRESRFDFANLKGTNLDRSNVQHGVFRHAMVAGFHPIKQSDELVWPQDVERLAWEIADCDLTSADFTRFRIMAGLGDKPEELVCLDGENPEDTQHFLLLLQNAGARFDFILINGIKHSPILSSPPNVIQGYIG